jgi:periplasmic divalent cation tolerance protein
MNENEYIQIITTTDSKDLAKKIACTLVEKKLAACAQVSGPIESTYEWQNKIENTEEFYCFIKTRKSLYKEVESCIKSLHSYSVPEIIALPIIDGNTSYLEWLDNAVAKNSK